jgi:hypothetical protein
LLPNLFEPGDPSFQIVECHGPDADFKHLAGCAHFACSRRGRICHHPQQRVDRGRTGLLETTDRLRKYLSPRFPQLILKVWILRPSPCRSSRDPGCRCRLI